MRYADNTKLTYKQLKKIIKFTPYNIIEQLDYSVKKHRIYSRIKFGNRVFIRIFGIPIINFALDKKNRYSKWCFGKCKPFLPTIVRKHYVSPDNESMDERFIKLGKHILLRIEKNKKNTRFLLLNKKNILTKRENKGYTFPQSLFRG